MYIDKDFICYYYLYHSVGITYGLVLGTGSTSLRIKYSYAPAGWPKDESLWAVWKFRHNRATMQYLDHHPCNGDGLTLTMSWDFAKLWPSFECLSLSFEMIAYFSDFSIGKMK